MHNRERRRLTAYIVLQSYPDNVGRYFLAHATTEEIDRHREYATRSSSSTKALAALLGDEQAIVVDGPDEVDAEEPAEGASEESLADYNQRQAYAQAAHELQEWFAQWADDELFWRDCPSTERDSVG